MTSANQNSVREFSTITASIFLAAILYVLSVGPVIAMVDCAELEDEWMEDVYAPLVWLYENTPLEQPLDVYINIWVRE